MAINDLNPTAAEKTAAELGAAGAQSLALAADVSDPGQVEEMVGRVREKWGRIHILVNNAGVGGPACLVREMPTRGWERTLAVNLSGVFHCCRAVAPGMMEDGGGRIVNVASLAARRMSKLGGADYTASKWGVVGFSKHLAFELAAFGINVNVLCPGPTLTPLVEARTSPEFREEVAGQVPLGRWITPEEQARAVLFLVGPGSEMITGLVMDVEGGQLLGLASDYQEDLARRTSISANNLAAIFRTKEEAQGG